MTAEILNLPAVQRATDDAEVVFNDLLNALERFSALPMPTLTRLGYDEGRGVIGVLPAIDRMKLRLTAIQILLATHLDQHFKGPRS